jgi:hypothetical protein
VLGARQFAGQALVPAGRFRHAPSWPVDAGALVADRRGGAPGAVFETLKSSFSSVTWEVVVNFSTLKFRQLVVGDLTSCRGP